MGYEECKGVVCGCVCALVFVIGLCVCLCVIRALTRHLVRSYYNKICGVKPTDATVSLQIIPPGLSGDSGQSNLKREGIIENKNRLVLGWIKTGFKCSWIWLSGLLHQLFDTVKLHLWTNHPELSLGVMSQLGNRHSGSDSLRKNGFHSVCGCNLHVFSAWFIEAAAHYGVSSWTASEVAHTMRRETTRMSNDIHVKGGRIISNTSCQSVQWIMYNAIVL